MEGNNNNFVFFTIITLCIIGILGVQILERNILESKAYGVELQLNEEIDLDGVLTDIVELELNGLEYEKFKNEVKGNGSFFEIKGDVYSKSILKSYSKEKLNE